MADVGRPTAADIGQVSSKSAQKPPDALTMLVELWSRSVNFGRNRPKLGRSRPNVGGHRRKFAPSGQTWPLPCQFWSNFVNFGSASRECGANLVEFWPMLDDSRPTLVDIGFNLDDSGRFRARFGGIWPASVNKWPNPGQRWTTPGQIWLNSGQVWSTSG